MAQVVGYHEDNVVFVEGPFVIVDAGGWRIECEMGLVGCNSTLCDISINRLSEAERGHRLRKYEEKKHAARECDWLNEQARNGRIIQEGLSWVCPQYAS